MHELIRRLLVELGEDPAREGLHKTPERVARALRFLTDGARQDPAQILRDAVFREDYDEMVVVRDIPFYSLCEHHMLPFFGQAHVAYLPQGRLVGLSKIPRVVDCFARRLQVQERMTQQIAETLQSVLTPRGVAVVLEAQHLCMQMRGVQKSGAVMTTSAMLGDFRAEGSARGEFLGLVGK